MEYSSHDEVDPFNDVSSDDLGTMTVPGGGACKEAAPDVNEEVGEHVADDDDNDNNDFE